MDAIPTILGVAVIGLLLWRLLWLAGKALFEIDRRAAEERARREGILPPKETARKSERRTI